MPATPGDMTRKLAFRARDAQATRAALLRAGQTVFSRSSYGDAGIREVAALAGTSSAMIPRYFGSKAGLFEAALADAIPAALALEGPRGDFGAFMARALLDPANEVRPPMMMALASGDAEAAPIARRVMHERGIVPLADWLEGHDRVERAMAITMTASGFALFLRQLDWPDIGAAETSRLAGWFARQVQALVDAVEGMAAGR